MTAAGVSVRLATAVGAAAVLLWMLSACTVTGAGVGVDYDAGYDAGYYEPWGYDYGGWGPGYRVGPGRDGDRRGDHSPHGYRPAPSSRSMPSIPSHSHGGGGGGGGARH